MKKLHIFLLAAAIALVSLVVTGCGQNHAVVGQWTRDPTSSVPIDYNHDVITVERGFGGLVLVLGREQVKMQSSETSAEGIVCRFRLKKSRVDGLTKKLFLITVQVTYHEKDDYLVIDDYQFSDSLSTPTKIVNAQNIRYFRAGNQTAEIASIAFNDNWTVSGAVLRAATIPSDLSLTVKKQSGAESVVPITESMVKNFDPQKTGRQNVKIYYYDYEVAFSVVVADVIVSKTATEGERIKTTVQSAIDVAEEGDLIYVGAGVYEENITIGVAVSLYGQNFGEKEFSGDYSTQLYFSANNAADSVISILVSDVKIDGMAVFGSPREGGSAAENTVKIGGNKFVNSVRISNCNIEAARASGVLADNSAATVVPVNVTDQNRITDCRVNGLSGNTSATGIKLLENANVKLTDCAVIGVDVGIFVENEGVKNTDGNLNHIHNNKIEVYRVGMVFRKIDTNMRVIGNKVRLNRSDTDQVLEGKYAFYVEELGINRRLIFNDNSTASDDGILFDYALYLQDDSGFRCSFDESNLSGGCAERRN